MSFALGIAGVGGVGAAVVIYGAIFGPNLLQSSNIVTSLANADTGLCLESSSAQVYTNNCNGNPNQKWTLSSGTTLTKVGTKLCLQSDDRKHVSVEDCSDSSYQKWAYVGGNSGNTLRNLATDFCLDSSRDQRVFTSACTGGTSQKWRQ